MQALLVGGPFHGSMISLSDQKALTLDLPSDTGKTVLYIRRSGGGFIDSDAALFVFGRPTYDQVLHAIERSALSKTAKMRTIGSSGDI